MTQRKDGLARRQQLFEAALKIFAEKGYRDATVAEICEKAEANVALVSYYFGSKEGLYIEVWREAFRAAVEKYPFDGGLNERTSAEERLRAFIRAMLHRMLDSGSLGYAGQILLMEISTPLESAAVEAAKEEVIKDIRTILDGIVQDLLGLEATKEQVVFCALSVVHQCLAFGLKKGQVPPIFRRMSKRDLLNAFTDHITAFSLAGIREVRKRITQDK